MARPTQTTWNRMAGRAGRVAAGLVARVASGRLTPEQFGARFYAYLTARHTAAVILGRKRGGDSSPPDNDDRLFGEFHAQTQSEFLAGFVDDLTAGRYTDPQGEIREGAVNARAALYVRRLLGTANEAFAATASDTDLIEWVLSADENCASCVEYAAGGPYHFAELPAYPGDGASDCLTACKCRLLRLRDNLSGFRAYEGE